MTDTPASLDAPPGWAEALDESLAGLAAGVPTVPGEVVHRELQESMLAWKRSGRVPWGAKRPHAVDRIRAEGATFKELAKSYNVGRATISRLAR